MFNFRKRGSAEVVSTTSWIRTYSKHFGDYKMID